MALQFECRKVALKQDRTGFILTLSMHPDEIPEELLRDFVGSRYACVLVRIQDDETPQEYNNRVQKAGMLCKEYDFQYFLKVNGEDAAANELCKRLSIESRTELNGNSDAKAKFDALLQDYQSWSNNNDPF
jgi:hypothetical protein